MKYHVGVEDIEPENWVAWVFEFPGCYARAATHEEAVALIPDAIQEHRARLERAGFVGEDVHPPSGFVVAEEFRAYHSSSEYLVNAFFDNDRIPLTDNDVNYAECVLTMNRSELTEIVSNLSDEILDQPIAGEVREDIRGIVRHVGTAEWWYWDRLGLAFPRETIPDGLSNLLCMVRNFTLQNLPAVAGSSSVTVRSGEAWSPRKLLRRTIWHERAHTLQIARYLRGIHSVG